MIAHVVLFRPKAALSAADRERLLEGLGAAHALIPRIRRFVVGSRLQLGTDYDAGARDFPFFVQLEFDTEADLRAYLTHPVHQQLSLGFHQMSDAAEAYDFTIGEMPGALDALRLVGER